MAACGSLQHIFDKPVPPESPTLMESLSSPAWTPITPMKSIDDSSFTEIFGELHFKENHDHHHLHPNSSSSCSSPFSTSTSSVPCSSSPLSSSSSSSPPLPMSLPIDLSPQGGVVLHHKDNDEPTTSDEKDIKTPKSIYPAIPTRRRSDSFSSMNSESLSLCTEGLGFESSDDVEDVKNDRDSDHHQSHEGRSSSSNAKHGIWEHRPGQLRRTRSVGTAFPPPISSIGTSGKPCLCFKSYRHGGRFILKEVRIPTQEFLQAYREDGRLKLHIFQSDDEIPEEGEEEEEEEDDDDDGYDDEEIDDEEEGNVKECDDYTRKDNGGEGYNDAENAKISNRIGSHS